jgi:hypothetical protein
MLRVGSYLIIGYNFELFCLLLAANLPIGFITSEAMSTRKLYAVLCNTLIIPVTSYSGL